MSFFFSDEGNRRIHIYIGGYGHLVDQCEMYICVWLLLDEKGSGKPNRRDARYIENLKINF